MGAYDPHDSSQSSSETSAFSIHSSLVYRCTAFSWLVPAS
jgi:hypothetical protein